MGRVVHFEITAGDTQRARKFYQQLFDWKLADSGMADDYLLAKTGDGPMGIDGAIMSKIYNDQPIILWVSVNNLNEMIDKVVAAGGKLAGERHSIPGIGETIYIRDSEGNIIGLIEPLPREN